MIDDGTLKLILKIIIGCTCSLWAVYFGIFRDYRNMIIYWRRKINKSSIIATSREEYEQLREQNRRAARQGQRVRPVGYIHLDPNLKLKITIMNIYTFVVIISGIVSLLLFRNNILSSIAIGSFIVLVFMYSLYTIFQLKKI